MTSAARILLASAAALSLAACETATPPPPAPPEAVGGPPSSAVFRPGDFSWSAVPGKGQIVGHLSFHTPRTAYTCAGAGVILTPETLWTRRRITILYNSPILSALPADEVRARTPSAPSGDYSAFVRRTTCDANNHFSFQGLANGAWFVITVAKPIVGSDPDMAIMRRVEIRAGKPVNVEL